MAGVRIPLSGVDYMPQDRIDYYAAEGVLGKESLITALVKTFARYSSRIAISEPDTLVTYAELDVLTDRGAAALWRLGLRPFDRVLFQMRNCKELVYAFISCLKIGVIPVCTLAAHRQQEIRVLGNHSAAKAHFVHADDARFDMVAFAREMKPQIATLAHIITVRGDSGEGVVSFEQLIEQEDGAAARQRVESFDPDPFQVILFQLSGGTSGVPKIIPRFGNEYLYSIGTVVDWHGLDESTVVFSPNPMMHNAPMLCFWAPTLLVGGEVVIAGGPSISDIEAVMIARKPTWVSLAKVHMLRLIESGAKDRIPREQIQACIVTEGATEMSEIFGAKCEPIYGMTEGVLSFCRKGDPVEAFARSVGRPICAYGQYQIVEIGTESELPIGEAGELLVRGPSVLCGYYDSASLNKEAFTKDGFYRTGDLLSFRLIEGEKFLFFEGRVKDVVDRGGEKINCSEVEVLLLQHPKVGDVACVGMPDPAYGERLCAFIVSIEGDGSLDVEGLGAFLSGLGLAKFKFPERIEIVETLPMTSSNKPSKPKRREYVTQRLMEERANETINI